jgi:hypothetical protein
VALGLEDAADDEALELVDTVVMNGLDFRPGHREALVERLDGQPGVGVLGEPLDGDLHQDRLSTMGRVLGAETRSFSREDAALAVRFRLARIRTYVP